MADPCVYREQINVDKPIALKGSKDPATGDRSEIRGSDEWTDSDFTDLGDGTWRSSLIVPDFPQERADLAPYVSCQPNTKRCLWPEQVFLDGEPLIQVDSSAAAGPGEFKVDSSRNIVLGESPSGRTVEVTTRRHWLTSDVDGAGPQTNGASDVTVEGFAMKHAANEWRSGGLMNRPPSSDADPGASRRYGGGSGWTVRDNELSDAHGAVLSVSGGDAAPHQIVGNRISRGGKLGIHKANEGALIKDNEVYDNNTELFCYAKEEAAGADHCNTKDGPKRLGSGVGQTIREAGGIKVGGWVDGVTIDSNEVHGNAGKGIWYDVYATNGTVSNNRVHHNARSGISYEISEGGKIFGNAVWENGWTTCTSYEGAGIVLSNSLETEVYANTLAWNADGIAVVGADRSGADQDLIHDVHVYDNTVVGENQAGKSSTGGARNHVALGWYQPKATDTMYQPASNNWGANNKYWYTTSEGSWERFRWQRPPTLKLLSEFDATPGEAGGRYLTQAEKDAALSGEGIPTAPPIPAANRPVEETCPAD